MKRRGLSLAVVVALIALLSVAAAAHDEQVVRWDIIIVSPELNVSAGGVASAKATDEGGTETSAITMTGSGTFEVSDNEKGKHDVTGGGTWMITTGAVTSSGSYKVTGLVRWVEAPGTPFANIDNIGNKDDGHAGLAVLRIKYSDGDLGILVLSCTINGTPPTLFEGITASKGFTDFWKVQAPTFSPTPANFTLFHVMNEED